MMKISIGNLEQIRTDIAAYRQTLEHPAGYGKSYYGALKLAVARYHKVRGDLDDSIRYLENLYAKWEFKNTRRLSDLREQLQTYADNFRELGYVFVKSRDRLSIRLADDFELTGEVNRLDIVPAGGYAVWLFTEKSRRWRNELRMPLIQSYYTQQWLPFGDVAVGVYDFSTGTFDSMIYTETEIADARDEAVQVLRSLWDASV